MKKNGMSYAYDLKSYRPDDMHGNAGHWVYLYEGDTHVGTVNPDGSVDLTVQAPGDTLTREAIVRVHSFRPTIEEDWGWDD